MIITSDACANAYVPADLQEGITHTHTHTSFIIMSNKGRLHALGLGAERPGITHQLETIRRWQIKDLNSMLNGNSSEELFLDSTTFDVQKLMLRVHKARDDVKSTLFQVWSKNNPSVLRLANCEKEAANCVRNAF